MRKRKRNCVEKSINFPSHFSWTPKIYIFVPPPYLAAQIAHNIRTKRSRKDEEIDIRAVHHRKAHINYPEDIQLIWKIAEEWKYHVQTLPWLFRLLERIGVNRSNPCHSVSFFFLLRNISGFYRHEFVCSAHIKWQFSCTNQSSGGAGGNSERFKFIQKALKEFACNHSRTEFFQPPSAPVSKFVKRIFLGDLIFCTYRRKKISMKTETLRGKKIIDRDAVK